MAKLRIVVALHDPGGAAAVVPLIPLLKERYDVAVYAHENAKRELQGVDYLAPADAGKIIDKERPALVLAGTSSPADSLDKQLIDAAKKRGIPTLAVIDYWSGYDVRFATIPDAIAVIDEAMKQEMMGAGIPGERVFVAGSPRFEALAARKFDREALRAKLAAQYKIDPAKKWLLYLSQPHGLPGEDPQLARKSFGYNEYDIAQTLKDCGGELLARFHPKEREDGRTALAGIPYVEAGGSDVNELIAAADLVAGASTVALIDAFIQRVPVVSVQPGMKGPDLCLLSRRGLIPRCETAGEVRAALQSPPVPQAEKFPVALHAAGRILGKVDALTGRPLKTVIIVQGRMGSTRLPGKVLLDVGGKPMMWHLMRRAQAAKLADEVIIATADNLENRPIVDFAKEYGFACYAGSETDLLDRYRTPCRERGADIVVRITADCPLADPAHIDMVIQYMKDHWGACDYVAVNKPYKLPAGMDVDAFDMRVIDTLWKTMEDKFYREWFAAYIWEHPQDWRMGDLGFKDDYTQYRLTVDYAEDLELIRAIFKEFGDKIFSFEDILALLKRRPDLSALNAVYTKDTGKKAMEAEKQKSRKKSG